MISGYSSAVQYDRNLIALFDIWCAGHDLDRLASDVYLADNQFVCVRVALNFFNLTDYDLFQITVSCLISLHFCSGECHCIRIFLRRAVKIRYVCFNPG